MDYSSVDTSVREAARRGELGKLLKSADGPSDELPSDALPSAVRRLATTRDSDGRTLLFDAAVGGNVDDIRLVMGMRDDQDATASDVNMRDDGGWSPLMSACSSNRPEAARWLLAAGAELDAGHRDVFYAASKGGAGMMEAIWGDREDGRRLADLRCRGSTLLHRAAGAGNVEVCKWLAGRMCQADVDVRAWVREVRDGAGETVLEVVDECLGEEARAGVLGAIMAACHEYDCDPRNPKNRK